MYVVPLPQNLDRNDIKWNYFFNP